MRHEEALQVAGDTEIPTLGFGGDRILIGPGLAEQAVRAYLEARAEPNKFHADMVRRAARVLLADFGEVER